MCGNAHQVWPRRSISPACPPLVNPPTQPLHHPVSRIPAGAASVEAEDWDTGAAVTLALDPEKTAVENAEALYKQVGSCCCMESMRLLAPPLAVCGRLRGHSCLHASPSNQSMLPCTALPCPPRTPVLPPPTSPTGPQAAACGGAGGSPAGGGTWRAGLPVRGGADAAAAGGRLAPGSAAGGAGAARGLCGLTARILVGVGRCCRLGLPVGGDTRVQAPSPLPGSPHLWPSPTPLRHSPTWLPAST